MILLKTIACLSQSKPDPDNRKTDIGGLYQMIEHLRDQNNMLNYQLRLATELGEENVVHKSKDSSVTLFFDNKGHLIKKQKLLYRNNTTVESSLFFFNKNGKPEYIENWHRTYYLMDNNRKPDTVFVFSRQGRSRSEYDTMGRITKHVVYLPTPLIKKLSFKYDSAGKKSQFNDDSGRGFWD
ncbi:hypothetical protein SAMN04487894_109160 [Niabella drilacis]|uniref:Uncharacterized protein n=2 Tax=Niabella drilacis (strain DSM 25811 / CCM 8410 / CCUG 62505 / LMG 26954 / E90) TaxID=1285928 RepID=A0A1G6V352_NIADE|nr:hypothetical protein SAMN04487894_109160 [Niabella drilacis]